MIMYIGRHSELSDLVYQLDKIQYTNGALPSGSHNMNTCMACSVSGPYQHNNHSIYIHVFTQVVIVKLNYSNRTVIASHASSWLVTKIVTYLK